jgi:hypothetical protein
LAVATNPAAEAAEDNNLGMIRVHNDWNMDPGLEAFLQKGTMAPP